MEGVDPAQTLRMLRDSDVHSADGAQCAELLAAAQTLTGWVESKVAAITTRVVELHDAGEGAPAADVAAEAAGVSAAEARRRERRAAVIAAAPSFGDALSCGAITAEHVDALANATARLDDGVVAEMLSHEAALLADAQRMSPPKFGRSVSGLARQLERDQGQTRDRWQRRDSFLSKKLCPRTGMVKGRFALHPELANQVFGAIDREVAAMVAEGERSGDPEFAERRFDRNRLAAEAWGRLVAGGHHTHRPLEADITVIVDHHTATTGEVHDHTVCETAHGVDLPPTSVRRLLCNGRVTPVVVDANGVVLSAGRTIRHANRHQRRALRAMYRTCAYGECDVEFDRCEIHHLLPWELGGRTDLDNLVPLCSRHHHTVHDHGWVLDLSPDRTLTVRQADGTMLMAGRPDVAPGPVGTDVEQPSSRRRRRPAA